MEPPRAEHAAAEIIEPVAPRAEPEAVDLEDTSLYFNRELSWLDFNDRVLQLAEDPSVPLLERVKFCAIWESNLDEFYMVRVANLHDQLEAGMDARGASCVSANGSRSVSSAIFAPHWRSTASASSPRTEPVPRSAPSSIASTRAASSPPSPPSRSASAVRFPTSRTCR